MDLILKSGLPHQEKGVLSVSNSLVGFQLKRSDFFYSNPKFEFKKNELLDNLKRVQSANNIHPEFQKQNHLGEFLNLDVKMETGTGKTYVYTSTIFELHKQFKINKFIVVVPSLPIKAGAKQFLEDDYVKKHFKDVCGYGTEIELQILESLKKTRGKQFFPSPVREFVSGSNQDKNKIQVLLTNMSLLTNSKILTSDNYDAGVEGFFRPIEAIRATNPFVIIDEPHRFSKDQKAFKFIKEEIQPQCVIRYGATFPTITIGRGRNKKDIKDYNNLVYNLSAAEAFNQNLIKGIAKEHFEPLSKNNDKVKVMAINSKKSVKFTYVQKDKSNKSFELKKDESLSVISEQFKGLVISGIGKNYVEFSNGQKKFQGEVFNTDIYSSSYQEQMLKLAIERHFEIERLNFQRRFKIKTLSLFFIDDIYSYRQDDNSGKEPYLKEAFERLLLEKIEEVIPTLDKKNESKYLEYLQESRKNIGRCHAGYFSQDNSDSDEDIAEEVNEILNEKKKLLSLYTSDGDVNTRRFLFSKWTLKEGWDNPNVFTITKLRSSGSENSKLQEVGRGLRLPVDENGNRISNEEFKLNYIIDFTEADFAERLVQEINSDLPEGFKITQELIEKVAAKRNLAPNELFKELILNDYIDMEKNVIMENSLIFFEKYPEFNMGLKPNKVIDGNKKISQKIKIRSRVFNELKPLWEKINEKYFIVYEKIEKDNYLKNALVEILKDGVFVEEIISSKRENLNTNSPELVTLEETNGVQYVINKTLRYGEFLKLINKKTNLPIQFLHEAIKTYSATTEINSAKINEHSAINFIERFNDWKIQNLMGRFSYKKSKITIKETALSNSDGSPKNEITQGRIGTSILPGKPVDKYLYDVYAYDSGLEKENLLVDGISEIVVYGKIPTNSIAIPTITGQTYSPDFMYLVKKKNGDKILNLIVETKDVENQSALRNNEKVKIDCAKIFFEEISKNGYHVEFHEQIKNKKIKQIIQDVLV